MRPQPGRQYPDRRRHMSTPTSLSFEERKKKLDADQAAYEEEERVRLELEQRLEALRVQKEQLRAEGKQGYGLSKPTSVAGCDAALQQALTQVFGEKDGVAIATCFVKEEVGVLKTATAVRCGDSDRRCRMTPAEFCDGFLGPCVAAFPERRA